MPIYEYKCKNCAKRLEILQGINEPKLTKCPECGKETLHKLISTAGFQLKGTGWYVTDFKDKDKAKTMPQEKGTTTKPKETQTKTAEKAKKDE